MKRLLLFSLLMYATFSCTEEVGMEDTKLNVPGILDLKTQAVSYNGQRLDITYHTLPDSSISFADSKSEENYKIIQEALAKNDDSGVMYSFVDSITYIFESRKAKDAFIRNRYNLDEFAGAEKKSNSLMVGTSDIKQPVSIDGDSVKRDQNYVSFPNELVEFSLTGSLGEFETQIITEEDGEGGRRISWRPKVPGSSIKLYSASNYGGTIYEVLNSSEPYEEFSGYLTNLPSAMNDAASSIKVNNESTRTLLVDFFKDYNADGPWFSVEIGPRNGASYYGLGLSNLANVNMNAACSIFCQSANDKISSVGFMWLKKLHLNPILNSTTNTIEGEEIPAEPLYTTIVKTSSSSSWNASASSSDYIGGSSNGCFEYQIDSKSTNVMFGLSYTQNNGANWDTIGFNVYVSDFEGDIIKLYNSGSYILTYPGAYSVGDVITVCRQGSYVNFYHNSNYIGRISANFSSHLYFDCSIWTPGAIIRKVDFGSW